MSGELIQLLVALAGILGSSGAAWVGVKVSLNGTRARVQEIHEDVRSIHEEIKRHREDHHELRGRVMVLEKNL